MTHNNISNKSYKEIHYMRKFVAMGIVVLIIATAGCITPDKTAIEETGNETDDRNISRYEGGEG